MIELKNNKGITLVALIITVILMLILVSAAAYSGINTYKNTQVAKFIAQMQLIQTKVDELVEEKNIESEKDNKEAKQEVEKEEKNVVEKTSQANAEPVKVKDPEFSMPVEGEITKGFAKDNLIYSETLEEWIVHLGIDIKAERTSVVKAAEGGTISSIKNDPRYGLTVVIEHTNGYKSVYSNLLTTEFVVEGEKVEKGQSIGTVGNSAVFEIADEPHLHFEMIKDGEYVDPTVYLK